MLTNQSQVQSHHPLYVTPTPANSPLPYVTQVPDSRALPRAQSLLTAFKLPTLSCPCPTPRGNPRKSCVLAFPLAPAAAAFWPNLVAPWEAILSSLGNHDEQQRSLDGRSSLRHINRLESHECNWYGESHPGSGHQTKKDAMWWATPPAPSPQWGDSRGVR